MKELNKEFTQIQDTHYSINEYGEVKNMNTGIILKPFLISDYLALNIYIDQKRKTVYLHHLMALVFLGYKAKRGKTTINHKDHNKQNPRLDNLEVISHRRNTALSYIHKNRALPTGVTENPKGKRRFKAQINYQGKPCYLGCFYTAEEAHQAYLDASDYIIKTNSRPPSVKQKKEK